MGSNEKYKNIDELIDSTRGGYLGYGYMEYRAKENPKSQWRSFLEIADKALDKLIENYRRKIWKTTFCFISNRFGTGDKETDKKKFFKLTEKVVDTYSIPIVRRLIRGDTLDPIGKYYSQKGTSPEKHVEINYKRIKKPVGEQKSFLKKLCGFMKTELNHPKESISHFRRDYSKMIPLFLVEETGVKNRAFNPNYKGKKADMIQRLMRFIGARKEMISKGYSHLFPGWTMEICRNLLAALKELLGELPNKGKNLTTYLFGNGPNLYELKKGMLWRELSRLFNQFRSYQLIPPDASKMGNREIENEEAKESDFELERFKKKVGELNYEILLKRFKGFKQQEIASELNISTRNVIRRIKALKKSYPQLNDTLPRRVS